MLTGWRRPFTVVYWTVTAVALIDGWTASRFLVPGIIESAYAGRSLEFLNNIISGQAEISLSKYIVAWNHLSNRLLAGAGLAAVAGYSIVIWNDRLRGLARRLVMEPDPSQTVPSAFLYAGAFIGLTAGVLEAIAVVTRVAYHPMDYSSEVVWMAPVSAAIVFGMLGAVLALIAMRWPVFPRFQFGVLALASVAAYAVIRPVFSSAHPLAAAVLALGVGVQAARLCGCGAAESRLRLRRWSGWLAGFVMVVALFHHGSDWGMERRALAALPDSPRGSPNILLLILDTVRAKSMSLYGHDRPTTPTLDSLARSSVVFDRAFATTSWTLPTHGTLFTGRWPSEMSVDFEVPLDDTFPTMAEYLSMNGYVSAGIVANYYYTTEYFGLDRGFQHYEDQPVSGPMLVQNTWLTKTVAKTILLRLGWHAELHRKSATQVTQDFLDWRSKAPERPYFAFLNYIDAHTPYRPPPPFRNMFADGDGQYWAGSVTSDEAAQAMEDAYDSGIAYIDHEIGVLLAELQRRGDLDNTVVIVTSDHGEEFGEHGIFGHDQNLYVDAIHVPLLFLLPTGAAGGTRVARPVTLRDIPATIVDLAGLEATAPFPGTSLRGQWDARHSSADMPVSPAFAELIRGSGTPRWAGGSLAIPQRAVVAGDRHYIVWSDGREELYDLAIDPTEQHDMSDGATTDLEVLREVLGTLP